MNKQKEIEEMAEVIYNSDGFDEAGNETAIADSLVTAGYGDIKQAVKEFVDNLIDECQPMGTMFHGTMFTITDDKILKIFKEKYEHGE